MKTIDEILKRDDYRKLIPALRNRAEEIAKKIEYKMVELDVDSIEINDFCLCLIQGRTNRGSYEYLAIGTRASGFYCVDGAFRDGYIHGDFNYPCSAASNNLMLNFLNNAKAFIGMLGDIETEKAKSITKALKDVEEL